MLKEKNASFQNDKSFERLATTVTVLLIVTQAALVVKDHFEEDDEVVESFVGRVFEGQNQILNSATAEMTQGEIQDIFAGWAADVTGISTKEFAM